MSKYPFVLTLTLIAALTPLHWSKGAVVYQSNEGWSVEGDDSQIAGNAIEQMHRAEALEAKKDDPGAFRAYKALVKKFGLSLLAPKAQRKLGILLEKHHDYDKAYDAYNVYLTKYPHGQDFDTVVESMFNIAKRFLNGEKRKLFGVKTTASMERAQQMFEGIVKSAPFSKWAPLAQFNVGETLEKQTKYPEAIQAYQVAVNKYPNDAVAENALYQQGYVRIRQLREGSYDKASAQKAKEAFEDFIYRYPQSEKVAQARENIKSLDTGVTKGALEVAKYYDRMKQHKAAVIYYNDVLKQQPGTPDAAYAKTRIDALRAEFGDDALRGGPELTENGARVQQHRKLQAKVDTVSRPDYVGPPVVVAAEPMDTAPSKPKLRTSPDNVPPVEPALPTAPDAGAPGNGPASPTPGLPTKDTGLPLPPP
jgi:outer membrane protein assembly factor BamD